MKTARWLVLFTALMGFLLPTFAADVAVKGYTRKDGTYVAPHMRSAPNSTKNDNFSTIGNVNPYTGKEGTRPGDAGTTVPRSATTAQPVEPRTSVPAPSERRSAELTSWSRLRLTMTSAEVVALVGEPNLKAARKWVYTTGGTITFDDADKVNGLTLPAGAQSAEVTEVARSSTAQTGTPASTVALRPGIQASSAEIAQATALVAAGWEYVMPVPKSPQAAWGNRDGRTTWFRGYWRNSSTGAMSSGIPAQEGIGFRGDGGAISGAWGNGGSPTVSKVQWLASKSGGPAAINVR